MAASALDQQETDKKQQKAAAKQTGGGQAGSLLSHDEDLMSKEKFIDPEEEKRKEAEKLLQQRFKTFELYYKDICNLLDVWDRTVGNVYRQPSPSDKSELEDHALAKRGGGQGKRELKKKDKDDSKKMTRNELQQQQQQQPSQSINQEQQPNALAEEKDQTEEQILAENLHAIQNPKTVEDKTKVMDGKEDGIGVPHLILEDFNKTDLDEIQKDSRFPQLGEVLDGMGMGPKGPPVPPPALFSIIAYPEYRKAPLGSEFSHYVFVTTNENDP